MLGVILKLGLYRNIPNTTPAPPTGRYVAEGYVAPGYIEGE